MSLDLEKQLSAYGAYHHNEINVLIHMVCVPLILFTFFCLCSNFGPLVAVPEWLQIPYLDLNGGTIAACTWGGLYVLLEPVAGTVLAAICLAAAAGTNYLRTQDPTLVNWVAAGVFVLSWIAQFIGHGKFEGRAPALLDNLFQAIFLAPLFVWLELLFRFGYRQELQARVEKAVLREIAKFKAGKSAKNGKAH